MTRRATQKPAPCFGEEIEMLREAIRRVFELAICSDDLTKTSTALQAISQGAARLARLAQADSEQKSRKKDFDDALEEALRQVMKELGLDDE